MKQVKINLKNGNVVIGSVWRHSGNAEKEYQLERYRREVRAFNKGKDTKDFHICINDMNGLDHEDRLFVDVPTEDIKDFEFVNDEYTVIFLDPKTGYRLTEYNPVETWEEIALTIELLKYEHEIDNVIANIIRNRYITSIYDKKPIVLTRISKIL